MWSSPATVPTQYRCRKPCLTLVFQPLWPQEAFEGDTFQHPPAQRPMNAPKDKGVLRLLAWYVCVCVRVCVHTCTLRSHGDVCLCVCMHVLCAEVTLRGVGVYLYVA